MRINFEVNNLEGMSFANKSNTYKVIIGEGRDFNTIESLIAVWFDGLEFPMGCSDSYKRDNKKIKTKLKEDYPEYFL